MEYYVGQPVLSAMSEDNTYVQELGPNQGKPVVRGIVTEILTRTGMDVWWENCNHPRYCRVEDLKDAG